MTSFFGQEGFDLSKNENAIQGEIIQDLTRLFHPEVILKNDPNYIQGIPDLLMVWDGLCYWLEVKKHRKAEYQPNQEWWLEHLGESSYSATIFPENKESVYDEIRKTHAARRNAQLPVCK